MSTSSERGGIRRIGIDARKLHDGGIGRYVRELLRRLPGLAPETRFVALVTPRGAADVRALGAPNLEARVVHARGYSLAEHVEVARAAHAAGLDLLHVPHYVVPAGARGPLVVTVHDLIHWRLPKTPLHRLYCRVALALVRRRARLVLAPSRAVARDLCGLAGIPEARVVVIPNGVEPPSALGPEDVTAFARRAGLRTPYALNVTNGLPHKGLDLLLEAWRDVTGLQLVLAGQGADRAAVRARLASAALPEGAVVALGELSEQDLALAYRGAATAVVASRLEGFGLPALEAMAAGVPVVAADAGALPEVVGDAGLIFPVDSVACLRRALYRLMPGSDPAEREGLIHRGLARAREFTWKRTAQETYAAYERALLGHT